jgi:transcriptional regulator with XRE-family HTH domain
MEYLRELRKIADLTQEDVAGGFHISRSHLVGLEQGSYIHGKTDEELKNKIFTVLRRMCFQKIQPLRFLDERIKTTEDNVSRLLNLEKNDLNQLFKERVYVFALDRKLTNYFPEEMDALSALRLNETLKGKIDIIILSDYDDPQKLIDEYKALKPK